jgi:hypothetical protein
MLGNFFVSHQNNLMKSIYDSEFSGYEHRIEQILILKDSHYLIKVSNTRSLHILFRTI